MHAPSPAMVIVGAGECGARAAVALREHGWQGDIVLVGEEPHAPYERPPLSKTFLTERLDFAPNADAARLAELGIEHRSSTRVTRLDLPNRQAILDAGESMPYHRLLIATGARARRLAIPGGEAAHSLRTHDDALALRERIRPGSRLVLIGGGFIGLELAASAAMMGARATVLETQPRLLSRNVPADIAAIIEQRHRAAGVALHFAATVKRIESADGISVIHLASGASIEADVVVAGIGAEPNVALAADAGLETRNGIVVDEHLRASDPHVFAAGDCACFVHPVFGGRRLRLESWRNAQEQGELAARNMLDMRARHEAVPWFWSDQYDLCIQIAGLPDMATVHVDRRPKPEALLRFHLDAQGRLVAASGVGPLGDIARDIRLAEMLIARGATPDPALLADPQLRLKSLLAA